MCVSVSRVCLVPGDQNPLKLELRVVVNHHEHILYRDILMGSQYRTWDKIDIHTCHVSHNPSDGKHLKRLTDQTPSR